MGVKKIMDTFFASMQEQVMSGYGGRLVNTPMGPFRWNDTIQLWENVNNGMVMNNISFQDSIMMLDYSTIGGGADMISVVPGGDPNLVLFINFNQETLGSVTYERSGPSARFVKSDGLIGATSANNPRFNYYTTGTTGGLLIENTSTNLLPATSFTNASVWVGTQDSEGNPLLESPNSIIVGITQPSGGLNVVGLIPIGDTVGQHHIYSSTAAASGISGQTFTASVWAKRYGNTFDRYLGIVCDNNNARITFDLQNDTYQTYTPTNIYGRVVNYINDWKRVETTWICPNDGPFTLWLVPQINLVDPITPYYAANGNTANGILIHWPQVELNSSASTWLAVPATAGVTRGNDLAYFAGTGFTWFNGSCGTFVFEFDKKTAGHTADNIKTRTVMAMNYATGVTAGFAINYLGNTLFINRSIDGQSFGNLSLTNGMNKIAFNYYTDIDSSDFIIKASLNGSTIFEQSFVPPLNPISGATFMTLGYKQALVGTTAYDYLDTTIRSVQYWNKALSGASLQQLST